MNKKYTCVDMFCGAGGLSKGFMDAGFKVEIGVDFDDAALLTFSKNHGAAEAMKLDLFNLDNVYVIEDALRKKGINKLDVLIGGPPCQGFSLAGNRVESDERNKLYTAMVKTAEVLRPQVVVLENVPGMLTLYDGKVKERIFQDFEELGYTMSVEVLYAPEYGVPQIRKRAVFVGLLYSPDKFKYPKPTLDNDHFITCEEAIGDLPSLQLSNGDIIYGDDIQNYTCDPQNSYQRLMRKNSKSVYNHIGSIPIEKTKKMISMVPEGKNYRALPEEYRKQYKYHEALTRYHSKKPSLTINTGHRSHFHYRYNRIPTVRESARLQSFPDDFIFFGNKSEQYRQVGNAVPPLLGYVIAKSVIETLDSKKPYIVSGKFDMIDLFAGCGGLTEGFLQNGSYEEIAAVEWLKPQVDTLRHRLATKWQHKDADESVMRFDIQRKNELYHGWNDSEFGQGRGLDYFVNKFGKVDLIIGGPPCQAYSIAGRIRDENGMRDDYRNYLFEHYLKAVKRYNPKAFVFENVPGILSAAPNGVQITKLIRDGFDSIGFEIIDDLKLAAVNASDYGVAQNRNRIIIVGLNKRYFPNCQDILNKFYKEILPGYKAKHKVTVKEAIGDLPPCVPFFDEAHHQKKVSHSTPVCDISWQIPRYSNLRDMDTFRLLAEDIESGKRKYDSKKIADLYEKKIGSKSPIHRYHVLEPDEPSTTIIAHLYKDGNRFIHYDSKQCRTITVREAARLQSFPDDFEFLGGRGSAYQMIGNAVPPLLAKAVADSIESILKE